MTSNQICASTDYNTVPTRLPMRLYMMVSGVSVAEALNCGDASVADISTDIGERLKSTMNRWKAHGLDTETGRVNYDQLAHSNLFDEYQHLADKLRHFDLTCLTNFNERMAFWINLYNVMLIHGAIAYGAKNSVLEIRGTFERIAYMIGGLRFSLDDIENGILRANRGHIAIPGVRFLEHDPRLKFVLETVDPRIHFTLVCGSTSCPPIGVYQAENLEFQLDLAAMNFINNGGVVLNKDKMTVSLSRIFQWYSSDFGGRWMGFGNKEPVLRYVAQFVADDEDAQFISDHAGNLNVTYQKYDWSLNA